jgi:endonuclease YncB( thermonuclease family)
MGAAIDFALCSRWLVTLDAADAFGTYRRMRLTYFPILAVMCWASGASAAPRPGSGASGNQIIPDCAGRVEIRRAHVVRVEKNGALVLSDGRAVLLEGIRLPDAALKDQALDALRDLALAGPVTFTSTPPKEDRYDRVRAQGFAGSSWLQVALLERGLAQVQIAPDRNECSPELYAAEGQARAGRLGIWASVTYIPKRPQAMKNNSSGFQLVEGYVTSVGSGGGRVFIDFGSDGQRLFSAVIAPEDRRAFRGFDLDGLTAHHIRVRGIVQEYRGRPEIALSNPAQIEILN